MKKSSIKILERITRAIRQSELSGKVIFQYNPYLELLMITTDSIQTGRTFRKMAKVNEIDLSPEYVEEYRKLGIEKMMVPAEELGVLARSLEQSNSCISVA